MGRYSSWWSRLLIIGIVVAVITPVGIYAVPQLQPYINLLPFYENPENSVLKDMVFVDSDVNAQNEWTWALTRLDIQFNNPMDADLRVPKASVAVRYLSGVLGTGYIPDVYDIPANGSVIIPMYMKIYNSGSQAVLFSHYLRALFWGQPFTILADINAYILIDGTLGEPLLGFKLPITIEMPMPVGLEGWDPTILQIYREPVSAGASVDVEVTAYDLGAGLSDNNSIYYRVDGGIWESTKLTGPAWDTEYKGLELGAAYPISSSNPESPVTLTGTIPAATSGHMVEYYVYLQDYTGTWEHDERGHYTESDIYEYTVGTTTGNQTIVFQDNYEDPFLFRFLKNAENRGISMANLMYEFGVSLLKYTPLIVPLSNIFYDYGIDMNYFLALTLTDFMQSLFLIADSSCPPGLYIETLGKQFGFDFNDMIAYMLPRIWYPFQGDNITTTAQVALEKLNDGDLSRQQFFENTLQISESDMREFLSPGMQISLGGELTTDDQYRNFYTIDETIPLKLDISLFGLDITIVDITLPMRISGAIIKANEWNYDIAAARIGSTDPYKVWLDLIITGNETNGHWQAASILLRSSYCAVKLDSVQEDFMYLVQSENSIIPREFPANDLYPYTHQLVSLSLLLVLGVVSYLVIKREILIHRKVERGIAAKKKLKQKGVFEKNSKDKAQSKYM